jgi:hypothetical protein
MPRRPAVIASLLGCLAVCVYFVTLAPSIFWGDSPELTSAAFSGGVAHPTGYPTYTMLGYAFTHGVPFGSVAWRMNLLSALSAAIAVGLLYLVLLRLTRRSAPAALGALLFAFGKTFWSQAVIAEVYAFHLLAVSLVLLCALSWDATGKRAWLLGAALTYGLAFTHHLQAILLAPALLWLAFTSPRRAQFFRELRWSLPLFVLPVVLYAYIPLAAWRDTPQNWNDARTWSNLYRHVTGWEYRELMFSKTPEMLKFDVLRYFGLLSAEWGYAVLPLAVLGAWSLVRQSRRLFVLTALLYVTSVAYALSYRIFDIESYYLGAHLVVAAWAAFGVRRLAVWLQLLFRRQHADPPKRRALARVVAVSFALLPASAVSANWSANDLHADFGALNYARTAVASLKPNAVVFVNGDYACFPLTYVLHVEKKRPDVSLVVLTDLFYKHRVRLLTRLEKEGVKVRPTECFTQDRSPVHRDSCLLERLVADNVDRRPVYLAIEPDKVAGLPWIAGLDRTFYRTAVSNFFTYELTKAPPVHPGPAALSGKPVSFGEGLRLLGYRAQPKARNDAAWMTLRYEWELNRPLPADTRVMTMITDAAGNFHRPISGPEFRSSHVLGQTVAPRPTPLGRRFTESIEVLVPREQWGQPLFVWVAVTSNERFLKAQGSESRFIALGQAPEIGTAPRLASDR